MAELHIDIKDVGMMRVPHFFHPSLAVHKIINSDGMTNCGRRMRRVDDLLQIARDGNARIPIVRLCRNCFDQQGVTNGEIKNGVLVFRIFSQPSLDE